MGRPRLEDGPEYVYRSGLKYRGRYYIGGRLYSAGIFDTPEAAKYHAKVARDGHHWQGMLEDDLSRYFGFTYLVINQRTGKRYVGKKQFYLWTGPQGGYKCTDPSKEYWDPKAWKKNDWELYTGSSDELNEDIGEYGISSFSFHILELCTSKLDLHLSELKWMIKWDVLEALDSNGDYAYYNKNIASLEFRAPFKHSDVAEAKGKTHEAMRLYYLKPTYCTCGRLIPFGFERCCK